jgi:L-ascorbate metabolism protein UlaG (beta-lactamase superfamily)
VWISGDTVLYEGLREVARRMDVGTALLHLGSVRFGVTGPVHYSLTAREAVKVCELMQPTTAIPVHYEGWTRFREGRSQVEGAFAHAPFEIRRQLLWVPIGETVQVAA